MIGFRKLLVMWVILVTLGVQGESFKGKISPLSDSEKIDYVLEHIYEIRSKNFDSAIYFIDKVLPIAEKLDRQNDIISLLKQKGIVYYYKGDLENELKYLQAALKQATKSENELLEGQVLYELSMYYNRRKELRTSLKMAEKALNKCTEGEDSACMANSLRGIGRLHIKFNNVDSALQFFQRSYAIKLAMNDSIGLPYALNDLGEIALMRGDFETAVDYMNQSNAIRKAIKDSMGLAINYHNLSNMYQQEGRLQKAKVEMQKSINLARQLGFVELLQASLSFQSDINLALGNGQEAVENIRESKAIADSMFTKNRSEALAEMEVKYKTEAQALELERKQAQLASQKWGAVAIIAGILLLAGLLYYRLYKKRRYEQQIKDLEVKNRIQGERERISKDLHDSVGAHLTKIVTDLDILSLTGGDEEKINTTREFAATTIHQLRDTIWAIHKDEYSYSEFMGKVRDYLNLYLGNNVKWSVQEKIERDDKLSPEEALNLIRIIQEATQNMLKHSGAENYIIELDALIGYKLTIQDDGIGIKVSQSPTGHYGLENMKLRAEKIGAELHIMSRTKGTIITVSSAA